jgi:hypothetical protein
MTQILSIVYPWSAAIISGLKDVENRDWQTRYRGPVAIHESLRHSREDITDFADVFRRSLPGENVSQWLCVNPPAPGMIIGVVDMTACVTSSSSPWFFGKFGFVMENPRRLPVPINRRGALGLRLLPSDVAAEIAAQLDAGVRHAS